MPEENKNIPSPKEEKLEYLQREEIVTMQKDIKKMRESEAEKERERIAGIGLEAKKPKIKPEEKIAEKPEEVLIPKPPKKPPSSRKFLARLGIMLILVLFCWGFYQASKFIPQFWQKKPPPEIIKEEELPPISIPLPLILVEKTQTSEISKNEEIPEVISQLMKEELTEGNLSRVVIKNLTENRLVSLADISQVFQIEVPEGLFQKLESDFSLTIFSQKEGKRIALIAKVKEKEGLADLLKSWEEKISKEGISVSGQKIQTLSPSFKTSFFEKLPIRYLTVSKQDLGICYIFFDDYLVITNSFESIKKSITKIKEIEKIGQVFIVGFEGTEITPQLEEFFKKYKPGGVLLLSKNIENKDQLKALISGLKELSLNETGLPLLVAVDQEGGLISRIEFLAEKTSQSEISNSQTAYQIGLNRGKELKELGINLNLAPLLDFSQEGDFIFSRSFQTTTPATIGELAKALILGQNSAKILTAIKHFPGYSGITFNPEDELAVLETIPEISQFKKALEAKPDFVMTSNVIYKEIDENLPFTFSSSSIQFLKDNLGSEILIISDDLAQDSLLKKFSLKEIVSKSIPTGVDIMIFSGYKVPVEQGLDAFFEAVKNNEIPEAKILETIAKIIQFKQKSLLP